MNIIFKKMTIDNFLSFNKEEFEFDKHIGLSLVTGINHDIPGSKNGCGKSAIINAFVFCLFGKMLNQMGLKNVANRNLPVRPTEITIELDVDDISYKIISGIKVNPQTGYCKLFCGDEDLTKHSVRETRAYIEKNILRTQFDIFLRSFVLTSDQFYNFFKMSKQDKRVFIENIFDLKVFGEMYRNIHADNLANDKELNTLDALVSSQSRDIKDLKEKYLKLETSRKTELDTLNKNIQNLIDKCGRQKGTLDKYDEDDLVKKRKKLQEHIQSIKSGKSEIEHKIREKTTLNKHRIKNYKDKVAYVKNYVNTYKELSEHSKPIMSEKLGLGTTKKEISIIVEEVKNDRKKIEDLNKTLSNIKTPDNIEDSIETITKVLNKIRELKYSLTHNKKTVKEKKEQKKKIEENPSIIKELLITKKTDYKTNYDKLTASVKTKNILTFIEKIVNEKNIRRLVVSDLIKLLNNQIQTYLISMGSDFTCMFDENLNYTFLTKNGQTEYSSFSGGEKMRLSIATSFAFRDFIVNRSGINSNVLILDEYIDGGIDDLAVTEIFKILREFHILYNQNIFVVSHREAVKLNSFDSIINVEKKNGISNIVENI